MGARHPRNKRIRAVAYPAPTSSGSLAWAQLAALTSHPPMGAVCRPYLYGVITVCAATMLTFWLTWRWGYTSDHVLTGLMAKSVIERGERPLFVWNFGYQGIALEVYALALLFKIFGYGPKILYSFSVICFGILLYAQARYNRMTAGPQAGLLSALLLGFGSPYFYRYVMRPQPNYTEIFIFGLAVMLIAQTLVRRHYVQGRPFDRSTVGFCLTGGFLAGFGLYTYVMMVFFLGCVFLYGFSIYLRDTWASSWWRRPRRALLAITLAWAGLAGGYVSHLFFSGTLQAMAPQDAASRVTLWLSVGLLPFMGAALVDVGLRWAHFAKRSLPLAGVAALGFIIGYAPQLHYTYWLHGISRARTGLTRSPEAFWHHLRLLMQGTQMYLNLDNTPFGWVATWVTVGLIATYAVAVVVGIARFIGGFAPRATVLRLGPLVYLPLCVVPLFGLSAAIFDVASCRYTLCLLLFATSAFAWVLTWLWGQKRRSLRATATVLLVILLVNNGVHLQHTLAQASREKFCGESAIAALHARDIHFGVAWYWYAYAISFYTQEDIILDPFEDGYNPHYHQAVAEAQRIAYLDKDTARMRHFPRQLLLWGRTYDKTDAWFGDGIAFVVLQARDGTQKPLVHRGNN